MLIIPYARLFFFPLTEISPLLSLAVAFTVQPDEGFITRTAAGAFALPKGVAPESWHAHDPELRASIPEADLAFGKPGKSDPAVTQRDALAAPEDHTGFW